MTVYHWVLLSAFIITCVYSIYLFVQALSSVNSRDYSVAKGTKLRAVAYSFSGAMSPKKKETAFLHLPTYTAGIIFHLGTFLSFLLIFLLFINTSFSSIFKYICSICLVVSFICGLLILIKRMINKRLKSISVPDDYFSNILTSGLQLFLALSLINKDFISFLLVYTGLVLLYMPVGKLRHALYFISSRVYLGIYFGRRGVWPNKKQ